MKTEQPIPASSAGPASGGPAPGAALAGAVVLGAAAAAAGLLLGLGVRGDLVSALGSPRFLFKLAVTAAVAWTAIRLALRLARPGPERWSAELALFGPPLALFVAVLLEVLSVPEAAWGARLVGAHWATCLLAVPLLSLVPLVPILLALRRGAGESGATVGFLAGLAAGGIGAFFYAFHGGDDSPLFVAAWYTLAIGLVGGLGALAGALLGPRAPRR
ncbi:DUF1109 domain-containing protein [Xanthobacter sp. V4C-4]|uniref:NrsF family protein n=1 Tax=Xanthobacter cornucopiae TaxID=3119924 RepID=UPI0037277BE5